MAQAFADFIANALTSYIAGEPDLPDFILRRDDGTIVYVDLEGGGNLWIIEVTEAEAVAKTTEGVS